jgi:hypothetical protein
MKAKLILFFIGILLLSLSAQSQETKLTSIEEIRSVFEMSDVGFYPEIINEPTNALKYKGDKKIAANIGAYSADMLYVVATSEDRSNIVQAYGAVMQLSNEYGLTDDVPKLILKRYEDGDATVEEVYDMFQKALDASERKLTEQDKREFFAYHTFGNYIEKLYLVSSIIERPKKTDVPEEVEANLKRNLIRYVGNQGMRLQGLLDLLKPYPNLSEDVIVREEVKELIEKYKVIGEKRSELMELGPAEFYNNKDVKAVFKQIKKIRTRIVKI